VDSNATRSRPDRSQLSVLLDSGLVATLRSAARQRGMTIAALVEKALEVELDGYVEPSTGSGDSPATQSSTVGSLNGRVSEHGPVSPDSRRRVDWDSILSAAQVKQQITQVLVLDPLEEIA